MCLICMYILCAYVFSMLLVEVYVENAHFNSFSSGCNKCPIVYLPTIFKIGLQWLLFIPGSSAYRGISFVLAPYLCFLPMISYVNQHLYAVITL